MLMPVPLKLVCVPYGVGVVRDPVRPHAVGVLHEQSLSGLKGVYGISARNTRWAAARYSLHVPVTLWRASPNSWLEYPCRDGDVDPSVGIDHRVGLVGIAVAAHAGSPLVHQRGRVVGLGQRGRGAPAAVTAARSVAGARSARLATVGELVPWPAGGELEPLHAASPMAAAARRAASPPDRRYVVFISRFLPRLVRAAPSEL